MPARPTLPIIDTNDVNLLVPFRPVQQDIIPVDRIEIFHAVYFNAFASRQRLQITYALGRPNRIVSAGHAVVMICVRRCDNITIRSRVIINKMHNRMGASALSRKSEMLSIKHVPIQSHAQFHLSRRGDRLPSHQKGCTFYFCLHYIHFAPKCLLDFCHFLLYTDLIVF